MNQSNNLLSKRRNNTSTYQGKENTNLSKNLHRFTWNSEICSYLENFLSVQTLTADQKLELKNEGLHIIEDMLALDIHNDKNSPKLNSFSVVSRQKISLIAEYVQTIKNDESRLDVPYREMYASVTSQHSYKNNNQYHPSFFEKSKKSEKKKYCSPMIALVALIVFFQILLFYMLVKGSFQEFRHKSLEDNPISKSKFIHSKRERKRSLFKDNVLLKEKGAREAEHEIQSDGEIRFSACSIVKDENDNLIEWIAYHYYMVNLRHLVLCMDPMSTSSPSSITKRWEEHTDLKVQIWNEDYYSNKQMKSGNETLELDKFLVHRLHLYQQQYCYLKCMKYLKKQNESWTLFIDPDEYMTYNSVGDDDLPFLFERNKKSKGYRVIFTELYRDPKRRHLIQFQKGRKVGNKVLDLWKRRTKLPHDSSSAMTIAKFIQSEQEKYPWNIGCINMPRLFFAPQVETDSSILNHLMPSSSDDFNASKFSTLSYFSHAKKRDKYSNKYGKNIVDLRKTSRKDMMAKSPHLISKKCGDKAELIPHDSGLLRVNHYTRQLDAFMSRMDVRKTVDVYKKRESFNQSQSYNIQGWLKQFVEQVGVEKAKILLEGVGEVHEYRHELYNHMKKNPNRYLEKQIPTTSL